MSTTVLLGDRQGRIRAELTQGSISAITWRLNKSGTVTLTVKRGARAFRDDWLVPGARVYAEFDNGLPAWGGVIDLPWTWHKGYVETRIHTIERLLEFAITPKTRAFYGELVGNIFIQILQEADARSSLGIRIGNVWRGGVIHYPRYHARDATWIINSSLCKMESCNYRFVPFLEDNFIMFRADLEELLGDDKRDRVLLAEGSNVTDAALTEQGDIVKPGHGDRQRATWAEREVVYAIEETSRRRYGLREKAISPADVSQSVTLNRYAETMIREGAYPHRLAELAVANVNPSPFTAYDVGDIVRVQLPGIGFNGYDAPMRVIARGYDPRTGDCGLVCDERFEYAPIVQGEDEFQLGEGE